MTIPDFRRCPICGAEEEFSVHSDERLYASNHLTLVVDENGQLTKGTWGLTEPAWDSATTVGYYADCCGESLPDIYQDALDQVMGVEREAEDPEPQQVDDHDQRFDDMYSNRTEIADHDLP